VLTYFDKSMNLKIILFVGLGGALGSVSRYCFTLLAQSLSLIQFPWATLSVNLIGSFVAGMLSQFWLQQSGTLLTQSPLLAALIANSEFKLFILVGFLGGFTTFSAFSLDTLILLKNGEAFKAFLFLSAHFVLGVLFCYLGFSTLNEFNKV